jgi:membrane protease subunit HflK
MSNMIGWAGRLRGLFSDSDGPWGPASGEGAKPPRRRPEPVPDEPGPWGSQPDRGPAGSGLSSLEELLRRGRARFGGGGGDWGDGFGDRSNRSYIYWGVIGFIVLWLVFTSFHRIAPEERGVVTRFGRYSHTLSPGIGLTLPSPIDRVQKVDVGNIRNIDLGSTDTETLMLTGDQNIIDIAYSVRWKIRDPEQYLFEIAQPDETIREVAESAMRAVVARVTLDQAMGEARGEIEAQVQDVMQRVLDAYQSGVSIQGIAIKQADPPAAVNESFKDVTAAQQQAQSYINQANAYSTQLTQRAQGEAAAFDKVYEQYKLAPDVTRRRMYYETMEEVLRKVDKTILEAPGGVTPYLPLPQVQRSQPRAEPAR